MTARPEARSSLSIVLPCFDEAERLPGTLAAYLAHFPPSRAEVELIVVDDGAPVSAQYNLVPHLGHRVEVYEFPNPFRAVNWGLAGDEHPQRALEQLRYVVVQRDLLGEQDRQLLDRLATVPAWRVAFDRQEVVVLERREPAR